MVAIFGAGQARAATLYVAAGGDLQAALNAAQPGDEIVLDKEGRFVGAFRLPAKPGGPAITIRSSARLPDRPLKWPDDGPWLPVIASGSLEAALTADGVSNWRLDGLRFESNAFGQGNIIELQNVMNITMDRLIIVAGPLGQKRAILGNGRNITLTRSHIENIWCTSQDSQAFLAYDGAGPYTISDNYLEAAGENIMFGGADSSSAERIPADILIERNRLSKRLEWKGVPRNVKNLLELKAAKRVTIRGNLFENNWTDGQTGWAIVFTPRNQDGRAPWSVVEDVLFERNIVRETEHGVNLIGYDDIQPSGRATRIAISNNLFETSSNFLQGGGEIGELSIEHNTINNGGPFMFLYAGGVSPAGATRREAAFAVERLTVRDNLAYGHNGGVAGDGTTPGTVALDQYTADYIWTNNVLAGLGVGTYPQVTWRPTISEYQSQFSNGYVLKASSPYSGAATDGENLGAPRLQVGPPGNFRLSG